MGQFRGYDVIAKIPDDVARHLGPDDDKLMLQELLADRFKLAMHAEFRELPFYALVIGKDGAKFELAKPREGSDGASERTSGGRTQLTFTGAPLWMLIHYLSQRLERPVVDHTNLTARYDFKLEWSPDLTQSTAQDSSPGIFTALQQQLGLRLESQKGPVQVIVIDQAQKPDEN